MVCLSKPEEIVQYWTPRTRPTLKQGPRKGHTAANHGTDQDDVGATSLDAKNNDEAANNMCVPEISMQLESMKRLLEVVQLENEFLKLEGKTNQCHPIGFGEYCCRGCQT